MFDGQSLARFAEKFEGRLIRPSDPEYDEARSLYNGMINKRPALIARCAEAADVVAAVNFGQRENALVAVRGGGHNGPGLGSCNGGIVIDLSDLKGIDIDPVERTVRVEPGCTQGEVDQAGSDYGLAVPAGIVSTTGIAGLTLGGGTGYLTRQHGLTIDNLLEAEVVLADGSVVKASESENPDLFWALRGGGGNFGIVTSFLFRMHEVSDIYGGPIFWALEDGPEVLSFYRDFLPGAPRRLGLFAGLKTVPSTAPFPREIWGRKICALIGGFNDSPEEGKAAIQEILDALPEPLMNGMDTMPFTALQTLFDPLLPKGLQWYWKGDFVGELPDAAIEVHIEQASRAPSELSLMHLYPIDGAVHEVDSGDTAWSCRNAQWSMVIAGIDRDPNKANLLKAWGRAYWEAVHPFNLSGANVNFMMDDEREGRVQASYGPNYDRLRAIKKRYDPDNFFRVNQNIPPAH